MSFNYRKSRQDSTPSADGVHDSPPRPTVIMHRPGTRAAGLYLLILVGAGLLGVWCRNRLLIGTVHGPVSQVLSRACRFSLPDHGLSIAVSGPEILSVTPDRMIDTDFEICIRNVSDRPIVFSRAYGDLILEVYDQSGAPLKRETVPGACGVFEGISALVILRPHDTLVTTIGAGGRLPVTQEETYFVEAVLEGNGGLEPEVDRLLKGYNYKPWAGSVLRSPRLAISSP